MRGCRIGVKGTAALCEALQLNAALIECDLRGNVVADVALGAVCEAMTRNATLVVQLGAIGVDDDDAFLTQQQLSTAFDD